MHVLPLNAVLGGMWLLFWAYWFRSALHERDKTTPLPKRSIIRLVAALLISPFVAIDFGFAAITNAGAHILGMVITVVGLLLAVRARVHMGKSWGPAGTSASGQLLTDGPYAIIRHPIYTGMLTGVIGTALATSWVWFILAAVLAWFMYGKVLAEEQALMNKFPQQYRAYRSVTLMLPPVAW